MTLPTEPDFEATRMAYDQFITEAMEFAIDDLAMDEEASNKMHLALTRTAMKWTGHPVGTYMVNRETGSRAHRVERAGGAPFWHVSHNDGSHEEWRTPQLPEPWEVLP